MDWTAVGSRGSHGSHGSGRSGSTKGSGSTGTSYGSGNTYGSGASGKLWRFWQFWRFGANFGESSTNYDKFEKLDKARKLILHTQACDGTWHLLLAVTPSVLPSVFKSVDFWLSAAIYGLGRLILFLELITIMELGSFKGLGVMGFLLALMLSFYVNISVKRLFQTNEDAMSLVRDINNLALIMRGFLWDTEEHRDLTRRCIDYITAAHVFGYIGFAKPYSTENLWKGFNEEFGALTDMEIPIVMKHREMGGSRMRECISWIIQGLGHAEYVDWICAPVAAELNTIVTKFEDDVQNLYDFRYLPIPFVSEHLLVTFMHVYLPIQTLEMAMQTSVLKKGIDDIATLIVIEVFGCILALLANVGFQGLFLVGAFLENPYGPGLCHSRVSTFCRIAIKEARKTLDAGSPYTFVEPLAETKMLRKQLNRKLKKYDKDCPAPAMGIRNLQERLRLSERDGPPLYTSEGSEWSDSSPGSPGRRSAPVDRGPLVDNSEGSDSSPGSPRRRSAPVDPYAQANLKASL